MWRSSMFLIVTGLDHLVGGHMLISGRTTLAAEENLSTDHPIRIFLKPFTHHSQFVNWHAVHALFPDKGLMYRATPFTPQGFDDLIAFSAEWVKNHSYYSMSTNVQAINNITDTTNLHS